MEAINYLRYLWKEPRYRERFLAIIAMAGIMLLVNACRCMPTLPQVLSYEEDNTAASGGMRRFSLFGAAEDKAPAKDTKEGP